MNNQELFELFKEILLATCAKIKSEYFDLPLSNGAFVYRERVYAYELYHLLRGELSQHQEFRHLSLNGEVDKSGRADFSNEKPDILLHSPGSMKKNIAIIEIKRAGGTDFKDAVSNLKKFTTEYNYSGGILLVFGGNPPQNCQVPNGCILIAHCFVGSDGIVIQ